MQSKFLFGDILFIFIILFISLYFDIKYRKIPNKFIKWFLFFGLLLNLFEIIFTYKIFLIIVSIIVFKLIFLILIFLIVLFLFSLKTIGGGDGKLIFLIFLAHPVKYLNFYFIFSFFFFFFLLFLVFFIINYLNNKLNKNSYAFEIFFKFYRITNKFNRFFFQIIFRFISLTHLSKNRDYKIKYLTFFYNELNQKFQLLSMYQPPLVLILLLIYFFDVFLMIGI